MNVQSLRAMHAGQSIVFNVRAGIPRAFIIIATTPVMLLCLLQPSLAARAAAALLDTRDACAACASVTPLERVLFVVAAFFMLRHLYQLGRTTALLAAMATVCSFLLLHAAYVDMTAGTGLV